MLDAASFTSGSLRTQSYARPGKLFTASANLIVANVGRLNAQVLTDIVDAVIEMLRGRRAG